MSILIFMEKYVGAAYIYKMYFNYKIANNETQYEFILY